jgi:uncharacterized protein
MSDSYAELQVILSVIVRGLVDDPEAVTVIVNLDGSAPVCQIRVAARDLGRLIGKNGRTARAIRIISDAHSMKSRRRVAIDIDSH